MIIRICLNDQFWDQLYIKQEIIQDTSSVFTRMNPDFADYKETQANDAIEQLLEYCPTCLTSFADFEDSFSYESSDRINKLDDSEIQQRMIFESERAQKIMDSILDPSSYYSQ